MVRIRTASIALAATSFLTGAGGVLLTSSSASANPVTTEHTYTGSVKSSLAGGGAKVYHLNCASPGPGYVEGVGENRTRPRITGKRGALVVHFQIAKETKPYAFGSRVVTSMTLRVEAPLSFSGSSKYSITLYCTSQVTEAWRVFG